MIEKLAVRLEGLSWKWVRADWVFKDMLSLMVFAEALSKDAPYSIALATDMGMKYHFRNVDISLMDEYYILVAGYGIADLSRVYIPLGFALDVEGWMGQWPDQDPEGGWVDFCDLTRTMDEGGDADRYFAAHFVGPSWWVVPFPNTATGQPSCASGLQKGDMK